MDLTGFGSIADLAGNIINKVWPDKTQAEKDAAAFQIQQLIVQSKQAEAQTDIDKTEAASPSLFVAGWRPFVGWICGTAFGVQFVVGPLGSWLASLVGHPAQFPNLDLGTMMPLLLGMLGLGGMRTYEKIQGVNSSH